MNKQNGPLDLLKSLLAKLTTGPPSGKKTGKQHYLLILLLVGVAAMILSNLWTEKPAAPTFSVLNETTPPEEVEVFGHKDQPAKKQDTKAAEEGYESRLKKILEEIAGVHSVTVLVTLEATNRHVFEKNTSLKSQTTEEEDKAGGQRRIEDQSHDEQLVIIRDGAKESPVLLEVRKPDVQGVLIVAGGAENIQVKKWIIEAVTRALGVPSHKVAVIPKKSKGDS